MCPELPVAASLTREVKTRLKPTCTVLGQHAGRVQCLDHRTASLLLHNIETDWITETPTPGRAATAQPNRYRAAGVARVQKEFTSAPIPDDLEQNEGRGEGSSRILGRASAPCISGTKFEIILIKKAFHSAGV